MAGKADLAAARTLLGAILLRCAEEEGGVKQLGFAINVHASTIRTWVRGRACPSGAALQRLVRYLRGEEPWAPDAVSVDEVLAWHEVAEHGAKQHPKGKPATSRCH